MSSPAPVPGRPHVLALALVVALLMGVSGAADPPKAGDRPPASVVPPDLAFQAETGDLKKDRREANEFSWKAFVALNWPAKADGRGEPDPGKTLGDPAEHVVWGSWKSTDELFPPDAATVPPTGWDSYDAAIAPLRFDDKGTRALKRLEFLPQKDAGRRKIFTQAGRLAEVNQVGFAGSPTGPLVAQNGTYVRYELRVNRAAYEFVVKNQYYLAAQLPSRNNLPAVGFPEHSMIVKAAWMELTDREAKDRYYRVTAELVDWTAAGGVTVRKAEMGLVGLHIAHRTPTRASWVWSTFEHTDNTEPGPCGTRAAFSRNDPTTPNDDDDQGFDYMPPPALPGAPLPPNPRPVDVFRLNRVHSTTHDVTAKHHASETVRRTVWRNYRLVATQWVPAPDAENVAPTAVKPIPKHGVANATIETYDQTSSCVRCHSFPKKPDFRFVFFPSIRAITE